MKKSMSFFVIIFLIIALSFIGCFDSKEDEDTSSTYRITRQNAYNPTTTLADYFIYQYTSDGKIDRVLHYNAGGVYQDITINTHDSSGHVTRQDMSTGFYYLISYDSNGKPSRNNYYNSSDVLQFYTIYTFNSNGQKIQSQRYNASDILQTTRTFSYNSAGKRISSNDGTALSTYTYDSNGNLSEITSTAGWRRTFIYQEGVTTVDMMLLGEW